LPLLVDFGLATRTSPPPAGAVGTLCYVAPEILRGEGYGAAVDLWAAGVTLHIVLSGFMPFYHPEDGALAQIICAGQLDLSEYPWQWTSEGCAVAWLQQSAAAPCALPTRRAAPGSQARRQRPPASVRPASAALYHLPAGSRTC
jgi:serine/threonine protein kinase